MVLSTLDSRPLTLDSWPLTLDPWLLTLEVRQHFLKGCTTLLPSLVVGCLEGIDIHLEVTEISLCKYICNHGTRLGLTLCEKFVCNEVRTSNLEPTFHRIVSTRNETDKNSWIVFGWWELVLLNWEKCRRYWNVSRHVNLLGRVLQMPEDKN